MFRVTPRAIFGTTLGTTFRALFTAAGAAAFAFAAGPSVAQGFPERPVTLVIPFAAGGSTDLVGRLVAQRMSQELGQSVVVENKGGAGGNLGAAQVAKANPDGYTILMGTVATHALNPALYKKMPYDPVTSFAPVSLLVIVPNVLVVNPNFEAKTVAELVALLKANPDKYSYASSGNGTPLHLSGELFKSLAGVEMQHIPYQGAGPALNDVLAGQVPIMFDNLPSSAGHIKSGKLRALGVTTAKRAPSFPDVPAIAETLPGYETYTWNALFAPAGTPPEVVAKLNAAANKAIADPEVQKRLADFSATVVGSTPAELEAHVKAEIAKWAPIVKESGAQLD
ncbi:tripartite-type tricarboxylate transporter receptor subunit TctC [Ancylobacter sp. 3268]|uniref:Bug family tripartite tricarboxylate transporter substrate binding protein n=1 Tax=Ancylobacter sp. 3268 TaxID=2817752 RepID=UPI002855BE9C|nr:tripartite tricarboxylate transporter substrate binding protein [Ancylobacter sp. 3268]MDR6952952.1 tripartite-type tricarboxylate transporter receptor subunit TctC [Ancylobacter sp. 3268]